MDDADQPLAGFILDHRYVGLALLHKALHRRRQVAGRGHRQRRGCQVGGRLIGIIEGTARGLKRNEALQPASFTDHKHPTPAAGDHRLERRWCRQVWRHRIRLFIQHLGNLSVAQQRDILAIADVVPHRLQLPGKERMPGQGPRQPDREHHRHHRPHRHGVRAGQLEHHQHGRNRRAEHRRRDCPHADNRVGR